MTRDVYTCGPQAHIDTIAREMFANRYGCVVVLEDEASDKVIGIFTAIDALRALIYFCEPVLRGPEQLLKAVNA